MGTFIYLNKENIRNPKYRGREIFAIFKQPGIETEKHKVRFIVQGHQVKETKFIIHISITVSHKNIKILISISAIYKLKVCNQNVIEAYIQAHNFLRKVFVIPDASFNLS